jgi:hypothetical protein
MKESRKTVSLRKRVGALGILREGKMVFSRRPPSRFWSVYLMLSGVVFLGSLPAAWATAGASGQPGVRYRAGKEVDFEELLIRGELQRPEISVVTGTVRQGADGLLRLRSDFTDRITMDAGEEVR